MKEIISMHLYLTYHEYVVELINPSIESLAIITDQSSALESKYRDFSEIQIAYTDFEADDVDYTTLLIDEAISHLRAVHDQIAVDVDNALSEIESVINDTLDMSNVLLLHGYKNLKLSMKVAGRRNEFKIEALEDDRVSVNHVIDGLGVTDRHEFDSAEELAEKLRDLQILEKKAKDMFFSGTVFSSAYEV